MPHAMVVGSSQPAAAAVERRLIESGFSLIERARDAGEALGRPRHKVDLIAVASDQRPSREQLVGLSRRFDAPVLIVGADLAKAVACLLSSAELAEGTVAGRLAA